MRCWFKLGGSGLANWVSSGCHAALQCSSHTASVFATVHATEVHSTPYSDAFTPGISSSSSPSFCPAMASGLLSTSTNIMRHHLLGSLLIH